MKYRFSSPVSSIKLSDDGRTAKGVLLGSGELLEADVVICNADLVYAYNNLLPPSSYAKRLSKRQGSCSSISFYWAMDQVLPELHTHNVFLAEKYKKSFDSIFKDQSLPDEPSFYVNVPSRVDSTAAPPGKDTVVVLCPVGHLMNDADSKGLKANSNQDWEALVSKARDAIFNVVEARTGARLRSHVIHEMVNTPQTWKEIFNLDKGGILGLSHSFFNVLSFRPHTKHDSIDRLYFVGASTHPGTGVPVVLAGAKLTSEQILDDFDMEKPWNNRKDASSPHGIGKLDQVQPRSNWSQAFIITAIGLIFTTLCFIKA